MAQCGPALAAGITGIETVAATVDLAGMGGSVVGAGDVAGKGAGLNGVILST